MLARSTRFLTNTMKVDWKNLIYFNEVRNLLIELLQQSSPLTSLPPLIDSYKVRKEATYSFQRDPELMSTFPWETPREALHITTIVVYHVILLHPLKFSSAFCIQSLVLPRNIWDWTRKLRSTGWWTMRPQAGCSIEVSIGGCEGSLRPIDFHEAASCCPVISIPQAWVNPHGLGRWEGNSNGFLILEFSDWDVVY